MNSIAQIKTVPINGPTGPTHAMMIAVNIDDAATAEAFIATVAEKFKVARMIAPPQTSMMLISLIGPLTADRFSACWREIAEKDPVVKTFMSLMVKADVIQGTKTGQQLSAASLH